MALGDVFEYIILSKLKLFDLNETNGYLSRNKIKTRKFICFSLDIWANEVTTIIKSNLSKRLIYKQHLNKK